VSIRVGIVGSGGMGRSHGARLAAMGVEIVGFCDVILDRAESAAGAWGGIATRSYSELLAAGPEGLLVCVPPDQHGEIELAACERGIHMFIEKPVTVDMKTGREIARAVRKSGIATVVGYKYRWDGYVRKAKKVLSERPAGMAVGWFWTGVPGVPWWRTLAESGGQMVEQATHIIDLARYLMGDIVEVQSFTSLAGTYDEPFDIPDSYVVNVRFANGGVGSFTSTCMLRGWGSSGLRTMSPGMTLEIMHPSTTWIDANGEQVESGGDDGYQSELECFIKAVTGDRSDVASDYADALATLAVTIAAMVSAERGGAPVDPRTL